MTKVIFTELHIDADDIAGYDLTDGMHGLIEAAATTLSNDNSGPLPKEGAVVER